MKLDRYFVKKAFPRPPRLRSFFPRSHRLRPPPTFLRKKKLFSPNCKKTFFRETAFPHFDLSGWFVQTFNRRKKKLVKNFFWRQNEIFFVDQFVCFQFSSQARNVFQHQRQTNFVGNESTSESGTKAEIRPILKKSGECQLPHDFTLETKFNRPVVGYLTTL